MAHETNASDWQEVLLQHLVHQTSLNDFWRERFAFLHDSAQPSFRVHLAVFVEPYLRFLLDGTKTVESRFSQKPCPPYKRLCKGDAILIKRSGGPVVGVCQIGSVWDYQLDPSSWNEVRRFETALGVQSPVFWEERAGASYATLMRVEHVLKIAPVSCGKRDRRGWAVLKLRSEHPKLSEEQL